MGQAVEAVAADMVSGSQVARDGVLCGPGWHGVMKGRIEDRHHRHPGVEYSSYSPNRRHGGIVVQGSQVMQRVNGSNDRIIQAHWLNKAMPPMDDAMADCLQAARRQKASRIEPIQHSSTRLLMVGDAGGVLIGAAMSHKIEACLATNAFYHPACQAPLCRRARPLCSGVNELEL